MRVKNNAIKKKKKRITYLSHLLSLFKHCPVSYLWRIAVGFRAMLNHDLPSRKHAWPRKKLAVAELMLGCLAETKPGVRKIKLLLFQR